MRNLDYDEVAEASTLRSIFWSSRRKAQHALAQLNEKIPPPAPLPSFIVKVGRRHFTAFTGEVKELE